MALVGYIRVSTEDQSLQRQSEALTHCDKVFEDKLSGKNTERKGLNDMLDYVRDGDTVCVVSISRLARNIRDLLRIVDTIAEKGANLKIIKEGIDTTTPFGKFMLTVFGAQAELEREYMLDRQREGIEIAKREGRYQGRPPIQIEHGLFLELYPMWKDGNMTAKKFMSLLEVKSNTFYRYVKKYESELTTSVQ